MVSASVCLPLLAQTPCKVDKLEGATVFFDKSGLPGLTPGSHLTVLRAGRALAELEVGKTPGQARVVRLHAAEPILPGDQIVSAGEVLPSGPAVGGPPQEKPSANVGKTPTVNTSSTVPALADLTLEGAESQYRDSFESHTHRAKFRQVLQSATFQPDEPKFLGMNQSDVVMWADVLSVNLGPGGFWGDPTFLLSSAYGAYMANRTRNQLFAGIEVQLEAEVTLWDDSLVTSYGQYTALVNGITDPKQYTAHMNNLFAQKGSKQGKVFDVKLKNIGQVKAQLSPFNWHIFMQGPNGTKVSALRYDQALDRQLDAGKEVSGAVYFPNTPAEEIVVSLEDMYGDRKDFNFRP